VGKFIKEKTMKYNKLTNLPEMIMNWCANVALMNESWGKEVELPSKLANEGVQMESFNKTAGRTTFLYDGWRLRFQVKTDDHKFYIEYEAQENWDE